MYDLEPGKNVDTSETRIQHSGKLLIVGGHVHDHALQLRLENVTKEHEIAIFNPEFDSEGRLRPIPPVLFSESGGYVLTRGDVIKVTSIYNNPTGEQMPHAGMGIVSGYFLPDKDKELHSARESTR